MKKTNKKNKIIILTAIALIIVIIGILIGTNAIKVNILTGKFNSANNGSSNGNLLPEYIKAGITLGGVTGTLEDLDTSDATATAEDIALGKTAYVNGVKITGTRAEPIELDPDEVYYADLPGEDGKPDGIPDGVIYADLAVGGSGEWGTDGSGKYEIPTETNLKQYYIEEEDYDGVFGTGKVIAQMEGTSGNDRFYVMALEDFDTNTFRWYANVDIDTYLPIVTSVDFGKGKDNTDTMIEKWNNEEFGAQHINDLWGFIQEKVNDGWFVPSRDEWSAFSDKLKITFDNYKNYKLSDYYWTSSQNDDVYCISFYNYYFYSNWAFDILYVRLSTTF